MKPLIVLLALIFSGPSHPQDGKQSFSLLLLNGKTGKPLVKSRLLVFYGDTPEQVARETHEVDLFTDEAGSVTWPSTQIPPAFLDIWVDYMHTCHPHVPIDLSQIQIDGLLAKNTCGSVAVRPKPGQLVIFARRPTLKEKMDW
jgi:hypothetical protein